MATGPAQAPRYKILLSYADADRSWVRGELLPALGLPSGTFATVEDLGLGEPRTEEFERLVVESECTLLVLTPAYLASRWSRFTERVAAYASVEGHRIIPLLLEACDIPIHIRLLEKLDCTDPAHQADQFARLRSFLSVTEPALKRIECPYPGMTPFGADRAASFFGRDEEIHYLTPRLRSQSFLIVIGASGCGKSSLVFAGIVPKLDSSGQWLIRSLRPGATPMAELARELEAPPDASTDWAAAGEALLEKQKRGRLLLVIDQLEEAFSLAPKPARAEFLSAIRRLSRSSRCVALMTMRADFFDSLLKSELSPIDPSEQMSLSPLRGVRLRESIVQPAERAGVYLEQRLVDRLLADAGDEPGALPMLQETMALLWETMDSRLLTERAYAQLDPQHPGIGVALSLRGQRALEGLTVAQRGVANRILLRLIGFGEGWPDTRQRQTVNELRSASASAADFEATLDRLTSNRILTLDAPGPGNVRVDLSHECLIAGWPTLRGLVQNRRDAELKRRRLVAKAEEWIRLGAGAGGLLDKIELDDATAWIEGQDAAELGVDSRLQDLVAASRKHLRWQLILRGGVVAACVAALAIAGWIFIPDQFANQARESLEQLGPAGVRTAIVNEAIWAVRLRDATYTREVLHETVQAMQRSGCFPFEATGVALNEDGSLLAGSSAAEVMVQTVDDRPVFTLHAPEGSGDLGPVAFRPRKSELAAATGSGKVIVWNLSSQAPTMKDGHGAAAVCVAYNRAGSLLATGSQDASILIRDADTLEVRRTLKMGGRINRLAFSPDGKYLAAATAESSDAMEFVARLWDLSNGQPVRDFRSHKREVTGVAFSPDGARLATSSADGRLRIWNLRDLHRVNPLQELSHPGVSDDPEWMANNAFSAIAFDEDGGMASAMSVRNFAELWDLGAGKPTDKLLGHKSGIRYLSYSGASGKHRLATLGADSKVRLYYLDTPELIARAKLLAGDH